MPKPDWNHSRFSGGAHLCRLSLPVIYFLAQRDTGHLRALHKASDSLTWRRMVSCSVLCMLYTYLLSTFLRRGTCILVARIRGGGISLFLGKSVIRMEDITNKTPTSKRYFWLCQEWFTFISFHCFYFIKMSLHSLKIVTLDLGILKSFFFLGDRVFVLFLF